MLGRQVTTPVVELVGQLVRQLKEHPVLQRNKIVIKKCLIPSRCTTSFKGIDAACGVVVCVCVCVCVWCVHRWLGWVPMRTRSRRS